MSTHSDPPESQLKPYSFYFRNVFAQRMRYVTKIAFFVAVLLSVLLTRHSTWASKIAALFYEVPIFFAALRVVQMTRTFNSTVVFSDAKSLYWQLLKTAASRQFWVSGVAMAFSALCLLGPFLPQSGVSYSVFSKEYRHKPLVNDQFVYFLFHSVAVGGLYNVQASVFQRYRLQFSYGIPINPPAKYLFAPVLRLAAVALTFTVAAALLVPVLYVLLHRTIYSSAWPVLVVFGLDTKSAPQWAFLNVRFLGLVAGYSWTAFFVLEFFNHAFNTYACIGCLHHAKPISSASPNPVITLLSGVRDVHPTDFLAELSNLAAFQELAYVASSPDPVALDYRNKIFNGSKASVMARSVWPSILDECSLVIKNTASRVNYRSPADLAALRSIDVKAPECDQDSYIFGNSSSAKIDPFSAKTDPFSAKTGPFSSKIDSFPNKADSFPRDSFDSFNDSVNDTTNLAISATSSPVKKYDNPQQARLAQIAANPLQSAPVSKAKTILLKAAYALDHRLLLPLNEWLSNLSSNKKLPKNVASIEKHLSAYYTQLLSTRIGFFWRTTLRRDTESRVLNPVNYGNAVLTLSGLLLRSIEEDRSNTITNAYLSEVLNLLEKPVRAFANYTDYLPASVYAPSTNNHLVALMHDLTVKEYYQLAVKFNYKLSDLQLSPRAFKLAKWVVAASIASTEKNAHQSGVYI